MKLITVKPKLFYGWQSHTWKNLTYKNVVVCARQHGKTYLMTELIRSFVYAPNIPEPEICLILPTIEDGYKLYKEEFDKAFKHNSAYSYPNEKTKEIEILRADGNIARIHIMGSIMKPKAPKGTSPHLIIMDEAGTNHPDCFLEACVPATNKSGGIIVVTGTVEDNWYRKLYRKAERKMKQGSKNWYCITVKFQDKWSQEVHPPHEQERILDSYDFADPDETLQFEKEMLCNWKASSREKTFSTDMDKAYAEDRITKILPLDMYKVGLTWDNGLTCTGVWYWQYAHNMVRFLKYREWRQKSFQEICRNIQEDLRQMGLSIGFQVLPFTMNNRSQGQEDLPTDAKIVFELLGYDGAFHINPKIANKAIKFKATHNFLNKCIFDEEECFQGIECVSNFKLIGATQKEKDTNDHSTDALSELAVAEGAGVLEDNKSSFVSFGLKEEENFDILRVNRSVLGPY